MGGHSPNIGFIKFIKFRPLVNDHPPPPRRFKGFCKVAEVSDVFFTHLVCILIYCIEADTGDICPAIAEHFQAERAFQRFWGCRNFTLSRGAQKWSTKKQSALRHPAFLTLEKTNDMLILQLFHHVLRCGYELLLPQAG